MLALGLEAAAGFRLEVGHAGQAKVCHRGLVTLAYQDRAAARGLASLHISEADASPKSKRSIFFENYERAGADVGKVITLEAGQATPRD